VAENDPRLPEVSVVVPAYNSARTIERCLASLAAQETLHRFEVIVVHSGTDLTCELARRALPSVWTVQLAARASAGAARNVGARLARGEVFAFIDSDAYADHRWITNVVQAAASGYDLVCGSIENANPRSAVSRAEHILMFNEFLPDAPPREAWFAVSANMLLRRDAYERFGPFAEVRAAEDVVFSRRLVAAGGRILFFPALRVFHDNRTDLAPFLRNQALLGRHTALARRLVHFVDTRSPVLFFLLLPVSPAAKTAKIALRLLRQHPRAIGRIVRELPLFLLGVCTYCLGMASSVASTADIEAERSRASTPFKLRLTRTEHG
jgi:GT2 family glycosyltransferase